MADPVSKTGKWIDVDTGQVVDKAPERGVQLVAEGGELTPDVQAAIDAAKAAAPAPVERATKAKARESR